MVALMMISCLSILGCNKRMEIVEIENTGKIDQSKKHQFEEFVFNQFLPSINKTNMNAIKSLMPARGFFPGGLITITGQELNGFMKEKTGIMYRYLYDNPSDDGMFPWLIKKISFVDWLKRNQYSGSILVRYNKFYDKVRDRYMIIAHVFFTESIESHEKYRFTFSYEKGRWFFSGVF